MIVWEKEKESLRASTALKLFHRMALGGTRPGFGEAGCNSELQTRNVWFGQDRQSLWISMSLTGKWKQQSLFTTVVANLDGIFQLSKLKREQVRIYFSFISSFCYYWLDFECSFKKDKKAITNFDAY